MIKPGCIAGSWFAGLFLFCGGATAQESIASKICQLAEVASLDAKTSPDGTLYLTGDVDGHQGDFLIDTGGLGLVLNYSTARHLGNGPRPGHGAGIQMIGGVELNQVVPANMVQFGNVASPKPWFAVAPDNAIGFSGEIGFFQPHALWPDFDMEIDFAKAKINLFLTDQCPGHVVYWTHQPYAAVPMSIDAFGHISVHAMLDGKPIEALVDTGAMESILTLDVATRALGISGATPGLVAKGSRVYNAMVEAKRYKYPFKTLTFEGISIANPDIAILNTGAVSRSDAFVLGIGVLRQLHLFVAYDEKKLYLTGAEDR